VEWRSFAPWISDAQLEQDLIICRALISLFSNKLIAENLAFRGGTALHKLFLKPPSRYSEDIDLVQMKAGAIGPMIDAVREALDTILGEPRRQRGEDSVTLAYRVESEIPPVVPLKLKVEINTREHFSVLGYKEYPFSIESRWYSGACVLRTYGLDELLGTKLRALYQRRKGRDLFDLWLGLTDGKANPKNVVQIFRKYMKEEGLKVSQREYRDNLAKKMKTKAFLADTDNLLRPGIEYDPHKAYQFVDQNVLGLL
jgi:predicted nucleotidyltransferase component of viral defense system